MANTYRGAYGTEGARPLGMGKGPIRTAMANDSFKYSLSDRMAARRADKAMVGATSPTTAPGQPMQPSASRLDASPTPRLDAQPRTPITYATKEGRMAEQSAATLRSTLGGAFGQRAQRKAENLEGRKALYRDMQTVGGANITESMRTQAGQLGVAQSRFQQSAGGLPAAPGMIARPGAAAMTTKTASVQGNAPAASQSPLQGRALAQHNIATKGIQGASADYFQRRDNEMLAKQQKQIDTAFTKPVEYAEAPTAKSGASTSSTASKPAKAAYRNPMALARPTSPTMSPNAPAPVASVAVGADEYGGKLDLRPQKPKPVFSSNTRFVDPQAEAGARKKVSDERFKANNEAIRKRREAQSTGPFARDSIAGMAFQWLQNDNFSGASQPKQKPTSKASSWRTPPPLTADLGKADIMPNKRKPGM